MTQREHSQYIQAAANTRVRKRGRAVRVIGNLLIIAGLLMMLGIGGWYGYTQWSNQQFKDELVAKLGSQAVDPPVSVAGTPVPVPTLPPPNGTALNTGLSGAAGRFSRETDNSPPLRLVIPGVKIDSKIVPVSWDMLPNPGGGVKSEWQVADYAVGHHSGSANPGEAGNVVLSGHVDYKGQVFKELHRVNKGDEVIVYTMKGQHLYVVTNIVLVKEEGVPEEQKRRNAAYMNPTPDPTLTMITCWPYGVDDHRLIVIAKPYQSALSTQSEYVIR